MNRVYTSIPRPEQTWTLFLSNTCYHPSRACHIYLMFKHADLSVSSLEQSCHGAQNFWLLYNLLDGKVFVTHWKFIMVSKTHS